MALSSTHVVSTIALEQLIYSLHILPIKRTFDRIILSKPENQFISLAQKESRLMMAISTAVPHLTRSEIALTSALTSMSSVVAAAILSSLAHRRALLSQTVAVGSLGQSSASELRHPTLTCWQLPSPDQHRTLTTRLRKQTIL